MAVFLISCLIWIVPVTSFEWTHHMILDQDGMFHILWKPEKDKITFELQVSYMSLDHENPNFVFKIVIRGHTLITLAHKGTYLVCKMLTTVL